MKAKKQELVATLLEALAPQLSLVVPAGHKTPKPLLKTVRQLAEQLVRVRNKQASKAGSPKPKELRQKLTDELVAVLDAHFAEDVLAEQENKVITETAEELAAKLTKLRSKQTQKPAFTDTVATDTTQAAPAKQARRKRPRAIPPVSVPAAS
ncbi:hypothetical protein J0X19_03335 [Hymenobacter sp. BT186]|uniref:Uncharacterized protein n=1 Tax=Hymenobacter telluris TaxID=2816474 RepID=A0A939JBN6_9BACT|nr:hypothetical protein [Hymenobacter telluris]MBO0356968.1 hypothetical protein [Hymenobacter telluris]MBW3372995.1 hypothetical protein [Hymenobacter norwichensis]